MNNKYIIYCIVILFLTIQADAYSLKIPEYRTNINHSELTGLNWSESGHIINSDFLIDSSISDWNIINGNTRIQLTNQSDFAGIAYSVYLDPYSSLVLLSTEGVDFYYSDSMVFSEILLSPAGVSISDSSKPDGYACWNAGYLISQATPCI